MSSQIQSERRAIIRSALEHIANAAPTESGRAGTPISYSPSAASPADVYMAVLAEFLECFGATHHNPQTDTFSVVSVQAGYFIRLLIALLDMNTPIIGDWQRVGLTLNADHPFNTAVDLLSALDQRRREIAPDTPPTRIVRCALGIIERILPSKERAYLMMWDAPARQWQLIGGRFEDRDITLRFTMLRELAEELALPHLMDGIDVIITELGAAFAIDYRSPTYGLFTRTTFQAYDVRLIGRPPAITADLHWVTETEIAAGQTADKQKIAAEPFLRLFAQAAPHIS